MNKKGFTPHQNFSDNHIFSKNPCSVCYRRLIKDILKFGTGFTLIELMLVVVIIGVLVSMVAPRLAGRSEEAKVSVAKVDVNANISVALDLYELDNGEYPDTESGLDTLRIKPGAADNWRGPYLKRKPIDPWGNPYIYKSPGNHNPDYDLYSYGPDGAEGGSDDVANWEEMQ